MNKIPVLGIMTCKISKNLFHEKGYYKFLQEFGKKNNINVYVFFPNEVDFKNKQVIGFQYNFSIKKWQRKWFPLPNFIYDRCFYTSKHMYLTYKPYIEQLKKDKNINFLGVGLKGKWEVYKILSSNPTFYKHLPRTELYKDSKQLLKWLKDSPIILKPIGGSHGAGVIKISYENNQYIINGRNLYNQKIRYKFSSQLSFLKWFILFTKNKKFLIQKFIDLYTSSNEPFDIRVLVQKNQLGKWDVTGTAARLGERFTVTSNLHGGGMVRNTEEILKNEYGNEKAEEILNRIYTLAHEIPPFIESFHGNLLELGLDVGVDRNGNVWIIEVNSKPGRRVFSLLKEKEKRYKSLVQPIIYTQYLLKRIGGKAV